MDKSLKFLFGSNNTLRTKENSCLKQDSEGELSICHCDSENTEWMVKDHRLINQNQCLQKFEKTKLQIRSINTTGEKEPNSIYRILNSNNTLFW